MALLQDALKSSKRGEGVKYKELVKPACDELLPFIGQLPRAKCSPTELVDEEHCLIFLGDVGNRGKGMNVYRVSVADARDVIVPDDLEDINMSI